MSSCSSKPIVVGLLLACLLIPAAGSCGRKPRQRARRTFVPGDWRAQENKVLAVRLTRPENLAVTETTRHLTFSAPGFGKLRITVKKTNDTRTLKDTKQYGRSRLERTMTFPGVTVRCQARVPPPQREIAIKICDSVVFTRPLVRKIRVERRPMKLQGLRDAKAFQRAIGAAEQRIEACWRGTVISLKRPPEGTLLLQLGYRADGQRDLIAVHYPTVYDRNPLARRCFNEALASLRFTTNGRLVHLQVRWDLLAY